MDGLMLIVVSAPHCRPSTTLILRNFRGKVRNIIRSVRLWRHRTCPPHRSPVRLPCTQARRLHTHIRLPLPAQLQDSRATYLHRSRGERRKMIRKRQHPRGNLYHQYTRHWPLSNHCHTPHPLPHQLFHLRPIIRPRSSHQRHQFRGHIPKHRLKVLRIRSRTVNHSGPTRLRPTKRVLRNYSRLRSLRAIRSSPRSIPTNLNSHNCGRLEQHKRTSRHYGQAYCNHEILLRTILARVLLAP